MKTMILEELTQYMLDENKITKQNKPDQNKPDQNKPDQNKQIKQDQIKQDKQMNQSFFYPDQKDQLFWCYYILKYGFSQYEYPGNISFVNEKQEKFKCIDNLRIHKQILKTFNIRNKDDMEDELANKSTISQKTFIALCCIEKINVILIHKNKYYELLHDNINTVHIIHNINMHNINHYLPINILTR